METEESISQPHCAFPRAFGPIQRAMPDLNTTVASLEATSLAWGHPGVSLGQEDPLARFKTPFCRWNNSGEP